MSRATKLTVLIAAGASSLRTARGFGVGGAFDAAHHHLPHAAADASAVASVLRDASSHLLAATTAPASSADPLSWYLDCLSARPLPTKMATGAALAAVGDAVAQGREDDAYDPARGASFAAFDATYRAAQHWLFPVVVDACRGGLVLGLLAAAGLAAPGDSEAAVAAATALERSLASQLLIVPFLYYPVFFLFTGAMQGLSFEEGLARARENFVPLMQRNLLFWVPVQYVQFGYVPTDLQIPFLSCAGLAWTFILSALAGSAKGYAAEEAAEETACATGTEEGCILPGDDRFPQAARPEVPFAGSPRPSQAPEAPPAAKTEERELVVK